MANWYRGRYYPTKPKKPSGLMVDLVTVVILSPIVLLLNLFKFKK